MEMIIKEGMKPEKTAFRGLISMFSSKMMFREAFYYFRIMTEHFDHFPSPATFNFLINCCPYERIDHFFNKIFVEFKWLDKNVNFFTTLITRAGDSNHFEDCVRYYEAMKLHGCTPNFVTFRILISRSFLCDDFLYFHFFYQEMSKFLKMNDFQMQEMLWIEIFNGNDQYVDNFLKTIRPSNHKNILHTNFSFLIQLLSTKKDSLSALRFYKEMRKLKIIPSSKNFVSVVQSLGKKKTFFFIFII
jgi:pentatricopeptide repeat protein